MHYHSFLFSVMCKCSYIVNEEGTNKGRKNKVVLASSSASSTQPTTPTNLISSPRRSQARVSTLKSTSGSRRSQAMDPRWGAQIKRGKLKRRVTIGSNQSTSSGSGDVDEPDWPPFADEDYIVFCFEEDGAFHVVMEESPKTVPTKFQCEFHGNVSCACTDEKNVTHIGLTSRRDCLLPSQEGDEDEQLSPKLLQTETNKGDDLLEMDKEVVRKESTASLECVHGSVESTDSSRVDWEEQLPDERTLELDEVEYPASPRNLLIIEDEDDDNVVSDFRMTFEEEIFLSPKSQLGLTMTIHDLLKDDNDSLCTVSEESSASDVKEDHDDQLVENEDLGSESAKSSVSNHSNSCSSFEFPALQWEWIDSPVTWPKQKRLHFRKDKSKPSCLRCCKF